MLPLTILSTHRYSDFLPINEIKEVFRLTLVDIVDNRTWIDFSDGSYRLGNDTGSLDLHKDLVLYYPSTCSCSPRRVRAEQSHDPHPREFIIDDTTSVICEAVEFLSLENPANWINPPFFARRADNKALLWHLLSGDAHPFARFRLSTTVTNTNNTGLTDRFTEPIAAKLVSRSEFLTDSLLLGTTTFTKSEIVQNTKLLANCALQFQNFIESPLHYRVYVFGDTLHTLSIDFDHSSANPDSRAVADHDATYRDIELADEDHNDLLTLVRNHLKLDFAAIDILKSDSDLFVIDINPNGTWHWAPDTIRHRLTDAFLSLLHQRARAL